MESARWCESSLERTRSGRWYTAVLVIFRKANWYLLSGSERRATRNWLRCNGQAGKRTNSPTSMPIKRLSWKKGRGLLPADLTGNPFPWAKSNNHREQGGTRSVIGGPGFGIISVVYLSFR